MTNYWLKKEKEKENKINFTDVLGTPTIMPNYWFEKQQKASIENNKVVNNNLSNLEVQSLLMSQLSLIRWQFNKLLSDCWFMENESIRRCGYMLEDVLWDLMDDGVIDEFTIRTRKDKKYGIRFVVAIEKDNFKCSFSQHIPKAYFEYKGRGIE